MTTKQWVSIGIWGFAVFLFVVSLPVSPGWAWVLLLIGGTIGGVVYAASYGEKHARKVQPPALPVQTPAPPAAPKTTRKRMNTTSYILLTLSVLPIFVFFYTLPNFMRDLPLMNSGIVTRGIVVSIHSDGCGSENSDHFSYDVQFIDNKGQTRVENVSQCNNTIGDLSVGEAISLLYAPDDPTVIAAQDGFTSQFQLDQIGVVGAVVALTGMILAILLIQLVGYLMVLRERGLSQGNWLLAVVSKNEVVASFIDSMLCRIGIHQGEWTKIGCQLSRYCIFCGKPQDREGHNWPPKASGRYFKDGSCEKRLKCLDCEETKSIGKYHEGRISWWNSTCKRCGEDLSGD